VTQCLTSDLFFVVLGGDDRPNLRVLEFEGLGVFSPHELHELRKVALRVEGLRVEGEREGEGEGEQEQE